MEQTVLTQEQKDFIGFVGAESSLSQYYLSGGTALSAYHFNHRFSDDLDFFTPEAVDGMAVQAFVARAKEALHADTIRFERLHDRHLFFFVWNNRELKVEFTAYPFPQLEAPAEKDGIRVDSVRDISANKLMALLDRFDPKDFVDMYYILHERPLGEIRADAERKFGVKLGASFIGGEFAKVARIEALPKMLKPLSIQELKDFFGEQARSLAGDVIEG